MLDALKSDGFATPDFYGFSIKETATEEEPQEYQFMQKINRPTVAQVIESIENNQINYGAVPNNQVIREARQYFHSDDEMMYPLVRAYHDFQTKAKEAIWNIGDVKMDNLFVYEFHPKTKKFSLMMIDPIKEETFIRPIKMRNDNLIINKIF